MKNRSESHRLSIIVPCYNEEKTLTSCIERVLSIADDELNLEVLIVDDCSSDGSLEIARDLERKYHVIRVCTHKVNQGKGAALRTGFKMASGDFVAVQDADLEYDPQDLKRLVQPLIENKADVVFGSRFLSHGMHRVLYFWHSMGNRFLTFLSNMFTDLNLTDMETCYKVFRTDLIKEIDLKENRFGFEPEIVAKIAQKRVRIYEMGISYYGRTYEEGKKIGAKDGFRALYCILRYNAHKAPLPIQFLLYLFIGGFSALFNLAAFKITYTLGLSLAASTFFAFFFAAGVNYTLCVMILFRHQAKWKSTAEVTVYLSLVFTVGSLDYLVTKYFIAAGYQALTAKSIATVFQVFLNFLGRKYIVFPEKSVGPWQPQVRQKVNL